MSPLRYSLFTNTIKINELTEASDEVPSILANFLTPEAYAILALVLVILLVFSAFFSISETAFSSVNIIRLKNYVDEKRRGSKKALWIAENFERTLSTTLVGNNLVNIGATTIGTVLFGSLIIDPTLANIITTIVMTIIILIFGEIIPKSYGKEYPEQWALKSSGFLYFLIKIMAPFVAFFIWLKRKIIKKEKSNQPTVTESELETIIETMEDQGVINRDDAEWLQGVIDIGEQTVHDIMTPRVDIIGIEVNMTADEIKNHFFAYKYSRMPVYVDDRDHIIGILTERDFFTAYINKKTIDLRSLISTPLYVTKELKVDDLIRKMQIAKKHFAIVSDEYGGTSGIVTLEDAIEELFGEIYDEHDDEDDVEIEIEQISDNTYLLSPDLPVDELYDFLELEKLPETSYPTIGGFLYGLVEELPLEGQVVEHESHMYQNDASGLIIEVPVKLHFTLLTVVERRILKIQLDIIKEKQKE